MKTLVVTALVVCAAGCYTPSQVDSFKLDRLLERTEKLEDKIDKLNEQLNSYTNQVFMLPVFPEANVDQQPNVVPL